MKGFSKISFQEFLKKHLNSILRYECDKVYSDECEFYHPSEASRIRHDKTFMHECRMRFYSTS